MKEEDESKEQLTKELRELRKRINQLKELVVDELTGLYSRRHFLDLAEHEFARARRFERPLSAIMLDVDNLKQVNDTYNPTIGDQVLDEVAKRCRATVRYVDIVGRYGGGKFALLLPEANLKVAKEIAKRLRKFMSKTPVTTKKGPVNLTISLGVTNITPDTTNLSAFLRQTDKAMQRAKKKGRNRIEVER